jgi:FtsZ-binding cell division protein ZapB
MIQKLLTFAKGLPWWAWVLVGLAILYLFNVASGSIYTQKLWNMLHDQIVQEDKAVQEELEKEVNRLDQREKELIQENARIKQQLAAAQEEKRVLLGRLHEIENQLNAVASNLPPSTDLDALAERFKKRGYSPVVLPRK